MAIALANFRGDRNVMKPQHYDPLLGILGEVVRKAIRLEGQQIIFFYKYEGKIRVFM